MMRAGLSSVRAMLAILALLLATHSAFAATPEPVRRIPVVVQPYYAVAPTLEARPKVEVGRAFDHALASTDRGEIVTVRDAIEAAAPTVTPMTMMVLAIRLYDVGLRDDAVFWFYAAKARYITLEDVVDVSVPGLATVVAAMKNFAGQVGPYINGYAFCDPARQHGTMLKAIAWTEKNPYDQLFSDRLAAKPGDRKANLAQSIQRLHASAAADSAKFNDPKFLAAFTKARKKNKTDAMFCWK
jgi:hypothetical protein